MKKFGNRIIALMSVLLVIFSLTQCEKDGVTSECDAEQNQMATEHREFKLTCKVSYNDDSVAVGWPVIMTLWKENCDGTTMDLVTLDNKETNQWGWCNSYYTAVYDYNNKRDRVLVRYEIGAYVYNFEYGWEDVAEGWSSDVSHFLTLPISSAEGGDESCSSFTYHGQTYNTVLIGEQCWMKENLNYASGNSWCYDNSSANCTTYGRLYDWHTALFVCPAGWHLPSDDEWNVLRIKSGGKDVAGGSLKETGYEHWESPNYGASNRDGFTGLPGGNLNTFEDFNQIGRSGNWWSSTEYSSANAWGRGIFYHVDEDSRFQTHKEMGFSVRCIKD